MVELKQIAKDSGYGFKIFFNGECVGALEYKEFWDGMPYLSLIKLSPEYMGKGIGTQSVMLLLKALKEKGCKALLTSTRADEQAQHFYRKLGFKECGCLILEDAPLPQPMEMFFIKTL